MKHSPKTHQKIIKRKNIWKDPEKHPKSPTAAFRLFGYRLLQPLQAFLIRSWNPRGGVHARLLWWFCWSIKSIGRIIPKLWFLWKDVKGKEIYNVIINEVKPPTIAVWYGPHPRTVWVKRCAKCWAALGWSPNAKALQCCSAWRSDAVLQKIWGSIFLMLNGKSSF